MSGHRREVQTLLDLALRLVQLGRGESESDRETEQLARIGRDLRAVGARPSTTSRLLLSVVSTIATSLPEDGIELRNSVRCLIEIDEARTNADARAPLDSIPDGEVPS